MQYLYEVPHIREGMDHLLRKDPVFSTLGVAPESLAWSYTPGGYASMVRIVLGQQVSTSAARSIWAKMQAGMTDVSPSAMLALSEDQMRAFGLSRPKIKYIHGMSEAVLAGTFDPDALNVMTDEAVHESITALKGFGRWSAHMYLMFSLARPDIWPSGDLGIQEGLRRYLNIKKRPDEKRTQKEGKRFAPHRTAASVLLWHMASQK